MRERSMTPSGINKHVLFRLVHAIFYCVPFHEVMEPNLYECLSAIGYLRNESRAIINT